MLEPSVPDGIRVYAIGDIHGRRDLLDSLLRRIEKDAASRRPVDREIIIFIGDYIDRGPQSREVIDRLLEPMPRAMEPVFLLGNHERILLDTLRNAEMLSLWLPNGGQATLRSYGIDLLNMASRPASSAAVSWLEQAIPESHRAFLNGLQLYKEIGDYLFVHAGLRPGVPLADQSNHDLLWIRADFLDHDGDFGRVVVHGHTATFEPDVRANRIGIDTGAVKTGRLTALNLEGRERRFLST
jgi:serine/threonine protein phosphatase 1